ncbi:CotH kinase family protein [Micromonospora sp. CPCC 206060]|uniref:CotH kinase family protein n=1 Tax=Micromonospora sp. CPCC 206060 TaxID=3122406 RepID=UPI002FEF07A4
MSAPRIRRPLLPRRIRYRIPVRVRQNWRLLTVCTAFLAVLTLVLSTERIRPYVTSSSDVPSGAVAVDIAGSGELFDPTRAHTISISFRDADYERMLETYFKEGEKEYVEADLTIDGTFIPSVGIRLKGNSTLGALTWKGQTRSSRQGGAGGPGGMPGGDGQRPGGGMLPGGGMSRVGLKGEEPETLPWLIRFDEFVEGRRYQGHQEIAVRVGGMGGGSTVLNEALSLALLDSTGEPAQRYAYTSFRVNDRPQTARLLVEHPDGNFAERLDSTGVLYKSLASSRFTDQGDDPVEYQDDFNQITMRGSQDLQPVIDLIQWVDGAGDEEFDAGLADRVDVPSFARYVALQNLLLNFDDMAGPGRNYYLWYDLGTKRFRVIGWDHNLTFSGNAEQGPHDSGGFGMMRNLGGGGLPAPSGAAQPGDVVVQPGGDAAQPGGGNGQGGPRGGMMTGHRLKERFLASSAFTDEYENAYRALYQEIYGSGRATQTLDAITTVLKTVDGVDAGSVETDATRLRTLVQQRTAALGRHEVITGS